MTTWPKQPVRWTEGRTLFVSVPFTWNLPGLRAIVAARSLWWDRAIVGGPAVQLMPGFFSTLDYVTEGADMAGVLQRVNPEATRTTVGCIRRCRFCAIGTGAVEPGPFRELPDWPDLPVLCDNNLLAASDAHFDRVIERLVRWGWADFNQGLDCRLLTRRHAERIAEIRRPMVRLALDRAADAEAWEHAFALLRSAGIAKSRIRSYCLIGFEDTPQDAWRRCLWVEKHGIKALPMWFHRLDQLKANAVLPDQLASGWDDEGRRRIMGWFYRHRGKPLEVDVQTEIAPAARTGAMEGAI